MPETQIALRTPTGMAQMGDIVGRRKEGGPVCGGGERRG